MRRILCGLFGAILVVGGCASAPPLTAGQVRPGDLLRHEAAYDGKVVEVAGYAVMGPERRVMKDDPNSRACIGLRGAEKYVGRSYEGWTSFRGVYHKQLCGPNDICLYWCGDAGVDVQ
jgi:hypothetical protein